MRERESVCVCVCDCVAYTWADMEKEIIQIKDFLKLTVIIAENMFDSFGSM